MGDFWVGSTKDSRHTVVYDKSIQDDSEFVYLYFVNGHTLCRLKKVFREKLSSVKNRYEIEEAVDQYKKWRTNNDVSNFADTPPAPRRKCEKCDGQGTWVDNQDNRVSWGNHQPAFGNVVETCPACDGAGYITDLL